PCPPPSAPATPWRCGSATRAARASWAASAPSWRSGPPPARGSPRRAARRPARPSRSRSRPARRGTSGPRSRARASPGSPTACACRSRGPTGPRRPWRPWRSCPRP
ncbi:MAG: hypothetical protein AVDCRST_MAG13-2463, partial [uncultured Solirubrobacteraceae bacterium]